ncbi:hypothetical protein LP420_01060 [Massilia sp. B-10]|nr:hypothetical protein LP420_01060 [Massilia sp. B-10]
MGNALAERIGRMAAGGDGDLVVSRKQALHEQLAKIPRTTDNQYILAHGFSLSDRVYFLLSGKIQQPRKIDALNKKNLAMVFP